MEAISSPGDAHNKQSQKPKKQKIKTQVLLPAQKRKRTDSKRPLASSSATRSDKRIDDIRQSLAFLCHDLLTFSSNTEAASRLNSSVHTHFLGPPYLSLEDGEFVSILDLSTLRGSMPPHSSSSASPPSSFLSAFLEEGMTALVAARRTKAVQGGGERDFVMCTSHDLAPLLLEACGLQKQYFETRVFKAAYRRWEKDVRKAAKKAGGS